MTNLEINVDIRHGSYVKELSDVQYQAVDINVKGVVLGRLDLEFQLLRKAIYQACVAVVAPYYEFDPAMLEKYLQQSADSAAQDSGPAVPPSQCDISEDSSDNGQERSESPLPE